MKKLLFVLALVLCLGFSAFALDGEGTEESPFIIECEEELALLHDFPDCNYKLNCDIYLEEIWIPVGSMGEVFSGVFDGNGYTVYDFAINRMTGNCGFLTVNEGVVKNLTIITTENGISFDFYNSSDASTTLGIICGSNNGTITNCVTKGKIDLFASSYNTHQQKYASGMYGDQYKTVVDHITVNAGAVAGNNNSNGIINNCYTLVDFSMKGRSTGSSSAAHSLNAGGIVVTNSGTITNCFVTVSQTMSTSSSRNCYGIASGNGKIENCFALGSFPENITKAYGIGSGTITNCYAAVKGSTAGIGTGTITNCFYDKEITGLSSTETGTPKSTMAMKIKKTYTSASWDFDNVWNISSSVNGGYPYLRFMKPQIEIKTDVLTSSTINEFEGKLVFNINRKNNATNKLIYIALYDENGALVRFFWVPNYTTRTNIIVITDNYSNAESAKIFVWENTESIKPLADCEEVQIVRNET